MPKFQIEIMEILSGIAEIEADSVDEAISIAKQQYTNEEIVLTNENHVTTEFKQYRDE